MEKVLMAEMNAKEYRKALEETDTVIIPIGSTEILGTHTPLGTDHLMAASISSKLGRLTQCIVAPTIPVGDALELSHWKCTLSVSTDTLKQYYLDICKSFVYHGLKRIFFFNNHLMNMPAVDFCGRSLRREGILLAQVDWWRIAFSVANDLIESVELPNGHGGEVTTSVIMAIHPELVDLSQATNEKTKAVWEFHKNYSVAAPSPFKSYPDFTDFCDSGGWGNPALSTKQKGDIIIDRGIKKIVDFINEFKKLPYPDIKE